MKGGKADPKGADKNAAAAPDKPKPKLIVPKMTTEQLIYDMTQGIDEESE